MTFTITNRKTGDYTTLDAANRHTTVAEALPILELDNNGTVYAIPRNDGGNIFDLAVKVPPANVFDGIASFIGGSVHCQPGSVPQVILS